MDSSQILLDAALVFGSTRSPEHLVKRVLEQLVFLFGAERALFALFDNQGHIEHAETHNLAWAGPGTPLPVSNHTLEEVLHHGRMRRVIDALEDVELSQRKSVLLHALRFILAMPVHAGDRVVGVLYVDSRAPMPEEAERQTEIMRGLATLVGLAVENARLLEEQRLRAELLAHLVHDLRSPLMVIASNAGWLREFDVSRDELHETAEDIEQSARKMKKMIDTTRRLSMVDAGVGPETVTVVNIPELLWAQARMHRTLSRMSDLAFAVSAGSIPEVATFPDRLDIIVDNLVFNALKYAQRGTAITLAANLRPDAGPPEALARKPGSAAVLFQRVVPLAPEHPTGFVEVSVHNFGPVIRPDILARLFTPWARGDETRNGELSSGLGLSIVDQCVRSLGGCVWARSSEAEGTRFSFTLPLRSTFARPARALTVPPPSR